MAAFHASLTCYVFIASNDPGKRIGAVVFGESGYYLTDLDNPAISAKHARELVDRFNGRLEIPAEVAESMLHGSMFGWLAPCADRARHFSASRSAAAHG